MDEQIYQQMEEVDLRHWWWAARKELLAGVIRGLSFPEKAELLEIGCGPGANQTMLACFDAVTTVEMSAEARVSAEKRLGRPILEGWLPGGLTSAASQVKQGGHELFTVPAFPFLWGVHDEVHHHFRRYRKAPLTAMVEAAGLEVVHGTYFNSFLFPLIALVRLVQRLLGGGRKSVEAELTVPPPWINVPLRVLFEMEGPLIRSLSLPFGVSLMVLARVPHPAPSGSEADVGT